MLSRLVLLAFVVLWYGWASQIDCNNPSSYLLRHNEFLTGGDLAWIFNSDVCFLGKLAWIAWCVALVIHLSAEWSSRRVLLALLGVTVFLTGLLNTPLMIRAAPAYVAILGFLLI